MPIDIEKEIDPLIQIDWTRMSDAVGFFQKADSTYPDRYSIVVTTDETTTDGSEDRLQQIKDNAEPMGFNHLLEYYEKLRSNLNGNSICRRLVCVRTPKFSYKNFSLNNCGQFKPLTTDSTPVCFAISMGRDVFQYF